MKLGNFGFSDPALRTQIHDWPDFTLRLRQKIVLMFDEMEESEACITTKDASDLS